MDTQEKHKDPFYKQREHALKKNKYLLRAAKETDPVSFALLMEQFKDTLDSFKSRDGNERGLFTIDLIAKTMLELIVTCANHTSFLYTRKCRSYGIRIVNNVYSAVKKIRQANYISCLTDELFTHRQILQIEAAAELDTTRDLIISLCRNLYGTEGMQTCVLVTSQLSDLSKKVISWSVSDRARYTNTRDKQGCPN